MVSRLGPACFLCCLNQEVAEGVGFEPTEVLPSPVFKTGAFNRSATLPFGPTPPRDAGRPIGGASGTRTPDTRIMIPLL